VSASYTVKHQVMNAVNYELKEASDYFCSYYKLKRQYGRGCVLGYMQSCIDNIKFTLLLNLSNGPPALILACPVKSLMESGSAGVCALRQAAYNGSHLPSPFSGPTSFIVDAILLELVP
jgi:hypothetical protein